MADDGIVVISRNQLQELLDDKVARLEDMIARCISILQSVSTEQRGAYLAGCGTGHRI